MKKVHDLQRESFQICKLIYETCESKGIKVFLGAGSLLGAIRHKGFIPWDDDIDLEIMIDDYPKLIKALSDCCGDVLHIQNFKTDDTFPFPFTKVFLKKELTEPLKYPDINTCGSAFVDIFPLSRCPSNHRVARLYFKIIEMLGVVIKSKLPEYGVGICGYTDPAAKMLFRGFRILPRPMLQVICERLRAFVHSVSGSAYLCYPGGKYGYPDECYRSCWYRDTVKKEFEQAFFPVPVGWHEILTHKYGEYMKLPDEENRKGHFEQGENYEGNSDGGRSWKQT